MRRAYLAVCLSAIVSLLHATGASACINDRETVRTETEFRKHYEFKSGYQEQERPPQYPAGKEWVPVAATWSGVGLLACSAALVVVNVRRARHT